MGGRMTYKRFVNRNRLHGDYDPESETYPLGILRGDLRRLERDSRDATGLRILADRSGTTPEQVERILNAFFDEDIIS